MYILIEMTTTTPIFTTTVSDDSIVDTMSKALPDTIVCQIPSEPLPCFCSDPVTIEIITDNFEQENDVYDIGNIYRWCKKLGLKVSSRKHKLVIKKINDKYDKMITEKKKTAKDKAEEFKRAETKRLADIEWDRKNRKLVSDETNTWKQRNEVPFSPRTAAKRRIQAVKEYEERKRILREEIPDWDATVFVKTTPITHYKEVPNVLCIHEHGKALKPGNADVVEYLIHLCIPNKFDSNGTTRLYMLKDVKKYAQARTTWETEFREVIVNGSIYFCTETVFPWEDPRDKSYLVEKTKYDRNATDPEYDMQQEELDWLNEQDE